MRRRFSKRKSPYRRRKSRFTRRVLRAEIANADTKKITVSSLLAANVLSGDATTRVATLFTPFTSLVQGTGVINFSGRSINPSGIQIRGAASTAAGGDYILRWTLFWSRSQAAYPGGTVYGSTTRSNAGPAQVPPFANPRIWDSVLIAASSPFVGDSFATQFDPTNVTVLKTKVIRVNPGGANTVVKPFKFFMRFKPNRLTFNDPAEQSLTVAPNFPKTGNYYLMRQAFPIGVANISSAVLGVLDESITLYWKDISG